MLSRIIVPSPTGQFGPASSTDVASITSHISPIHPHTLKKMQPEACIPTSSPPVNGKKEEDQTNDVADPPLAALTPPFISKDLELLRAVIESEGAPNRGEEYVNYIKSQGNAPSMLSVFHSLPRH